MISNYVPPYLCNSKILKKLYEAQQVEIDDINLDIEDLIAQCFVKTATWGLDIWESELGIVTNTQKSYEERRNKILAKLRVQAPVTKYAIKSIAEIFAETTNVIQHNEEYWFEINLETHSGFSNFLDDLMDVIEDLKPAHLGVRYKLTSVKDYQITQYIGSTIVNAKYYQLSSDFNINYLNEGSNNVASNLVKTSNYVLTNNINEDIQLTANLVQGSTPANTIKYEIS